jgi:2-hydroxychromene-2-carboxylate isomerase|tara:strand:- start:924 stop:1565 length:642 start_codon:yes stop_codon:yes gene_type:complete
MPELEVDLYFSFRSPWSYFGASQMYDLQQEYALRVNLLVVNPIFIRYNEFFNRAHEKWRPYFLTDLLRYSEYRGLPIGPPRPDPINVDLPVDDPGHLVHTLSPLGLAAAAAGRGIEFAREVSTIVWNGKIDGWDRGDHLTLAAERAGLELSALQQWLSDNGDIWPQQLLANDRALEEHHWGVPTMVFQGEPFFGQDKIELLLWRMQQKGLKKR